LIIADFDIVDITNLNRQIYYIDQLGKSKTDAAKENLLKINPYISIEDYNIMLKPTNIYRILDKADAVAECFDAPDQKQMIVETVLSEFRDVPIFSASGMAGIGGSNMIKTKYISNRHIICGDLETSAQIGMGLMAPRVAIAAAHQANAIIKYLLDGKIEKDDFDALI
jgi:sulfur carrier protein ThiS adenylyltransferase